VVALAGQGLVGAAAAPAPACNGFTSVSRPPFGPVSLLAESASRPPAVFVSELSGRVRRLDGATGKTRWTVVDNSIRSGVLRAGAGANVVSVAPDDCGAVTLVARDAATGTRRWTRRQPGHGSAAFGDGHFLLTGSGDLDRDGWADVAVLETSANETVGAAGRYFNVTVGHPSGQGTLPTAPWRAGYFVLNGRTGKPLIQQDLGSGTGPIPILTWAGDRIVVAVPESAAATKVMAVGPHGPVWSRTLGAAATDIDLHAVPGKVLVLQGASYGTTVLGGTLDALDLSTGAVAWTAPVGGTDQVSVGSRGEVYVSGQFPGGRVLRLDQATGLPLWAQPLTGVSAVTPLADFDGDGLAEAFAAGVAANTILSSTDGHSLLSVPGIEDAYPVGDLDGDKHDDLLTVEWDDLTPGNASPVVTVRLRHGLGAVRWMRKVAVCAGGALRVATTAGPQGSIVLWDATCPYVVLASRTGQERWRLPA
jgi:hypothetical protein